MFGFKISDFRFDYVDFGSAVRCFNSDARFEDSGTSGFSTSLFWSYNKLLINLSKII